MNWIRKALKGISLTAALFVFQACYGTMQDYYEAKVTFHVVDDNTGEPLQGVDIWAVELANDSTQWNSIPSSTRTPPTSRPTPSCAPTTPTPSIYA